MQIDENQPLARLALRGMFPRSPFQCWNHCVSKFEKRAFQASGGDIWPPVAQGHHMVEVATNPETKNPTAPLESAYSSQNRVASK